MRWQWCTDGRGIGFGGGRGSRLPHRILDCLRAPFLALNVDAGLVDTLAELLPPFDKNALRCAVQLVNSLLHVLEHAKYIESTRDALAGILEL